MLLELRLICHDVVVSADEVFIEFIEEGLSRNLYADSEDYLGIDHIFLQGSIQYAKMSFSWLFDGIISLIFSAHNLVQMNLII